MQHESCSRLMPHLYGCCKIEKISKDKSLHKDEIVQCQQGFFFFSRNHSQSLKAYLVPKELRIQKYTTS